ncbi:hypothetical protein [Streptomyces canus]|uniref:hypothetical protein n=1 Tax=Streptomyces canus TaxID=58343 RepID=UPI00039BA8B6|nr:hypothetical protein [Streptomyces canus]
MDRKMIKAKLRELAADPGQPGAAAEVQRLKGALRRLPRTQPEKAQSAERTRSDTLLPDGLSEADRAAVETWPPELCARLHDHALTQTILPWRV